MIGVCILWFYYFSVFFESYSNSISNYICVWVFQFGLAAFFKFVLNTLEVQLRKLLVGIVFLLHQFSWHIFE